MKLTSVISEEIQSPFHFITGSVNTLILAANAYNLFKDFYNKNIQPRPVFPSIQRFSSDLLKTTKALIYIAT